MNVHWNYLNRFVICSTSPFALVCYPATGKRHIYIIPVHKKGPKHKKENYRQISLTSIISKTAEKIVKSRVVSFWSEHQLLNPNQFGYLEGRSTMLQLLSCYDDWCVSRNSSKACDVIFLELSKAFGEDSTWSWR